MADLPLAITMGDPAGVGPELTARLWQRRLEDNIPPFIFIGAVEAISALDKTLPCQTIQNPEDALDVWGHALPVIDIELSAANEAGILNPANGPAVIKAIDTAVGLATSGLVSGIVTAPIHKNNLYQAGFSAPGHTEYLAELSGLPQNHSVMMLTARDLRVVPVTKHIALREVANTLTDRDIIHAGHILHRDLQTRFGITAPRIAIAGLNPHAGEGGAMGMEEVTHILPAIQALRDDGISVTDPLPADTLFHQEARQSYDAVLCMYHDQALIPVKTLDFWGGVNVTLGLPFIRTSPDHGTALELAGKNIARVDSMRAAILMADHMAKQGKICD